MPVRDRRRPFWSKWVWKDWDAKTKDLSPAEYTAYHRLLSYAATCSPDLCSIPNDDRRLALASGLSLCVWRRVRDRVLSFWVIEISEDGSSRYTNHRLRDDAGVFSQLVAKSMKGVNARLHLDGRQVQPRARSDSGVGVTESVKAEAFESSNNGKGTESEKSRKEEWLQAFDEDFYPDYPRHVKPDAARRAWLAVKPWDQETCDRLAASLDRWKRYWDEHETPKDKIPYPASFLNGGQWKEDPQ